MSIKGVGGFHLALWCCLLFLGNVQYNLLPMHHLFIWSPLACLFILVGIHEGDAAFGQSVRFLFLYSITAVAFVTFFGLQQVFGLKRFFLS